LVAARKHGANAAHPRVRPGQAHQRTRAGSGSTDTQSEADIDDSMASVSRQIAKSPFPVGACQCPYKLDWSADGDTDALGK
jgi:hypothetical protein